MAEKIVVFGAGATGRGHVGLLAWQAGFEVVFVDKKPDLVTLLQQAGHYTVRLYGSGVQEIDVSGYRVFHAHERQAIAQEVAGAALVLTAVFDDNLADVALTLALAATLCRLQGRTAPLNCIACENMMDSSSALGRHVYTHLRGADRDYANEMFGFPDCMISRIVPRPDANPLLIVAEDYNEWTTRADAFIGDKPPALTALELVDNQSARLERKLFIHNGGHAVCGYVGFHRGHTYIHEAVADPIVGAHVAGALDELGSVVQRRHAFSAASIDAYKADLGRRGQVAEMADEILRVVRDPVRKLSPKERLVAPALLAVEYGLPRAWIVKGIVAALKYQHPADAQSRRLAEMLAQHGLEYTLKEICQIENGSPLAVEIADAWGHWDL
jgi:mannitol-1-phosphate 5-dehydrogenase